MTDCPACGRALPPLATWNVGDRFLAPARRGGLPVHWRVLTPPAWALDGAATPYVWAEPLVYPGGPRVWPLADIPAQEARSP